MPGSPSSSTPTTSSTKRSGATPRRSPRRSSYACRVPRRPLPTTNAAGTPAPPSSQVAQQQENTLKAETRRQMGGRGPRQEAAEGRCEGRRSPRRNSAVDNRPTRNSVVDKTVSLAEEVHQAPTPGDQRAREIRLIPSSASEPALGISEDPALRGCAIMGKRRIFLDGFPIPSLRNAAVFQNYEELATRIIQASSVKLEVFRIPSLRT